MSVKTHPVRVVLLLGGLFLAGDYWAPAVRRGATSRRETAFVGLQSQPCLQPRPQFPPSRCARQASLRTRDGIPRLEYASGRYSRWRWRDHKVNYIQKGPLDGQKVLLVHGFGASAYHWRHNILALADEGYNVHAVDLLGFGRSDKPLIQYGPALWTEQLVAFIEQVISAPVAIVGNSIGGYSALRAAATRPDLVTALALINGAGPFSDDDQAARLQKQLTSGGEQTLLALGQMAATSAALPDGARSSIERGLVSGAFYLLRTPARVREILGALYPASAANVDDELISSILLPAYHPNALEVYYRIMSRSPQRQLTDDDFVDSLSGRLEQPLLLLWGDRDPWVQPSVADKVASAYGGPRCEKVRLVAGHCPMDEVPLQVNQALIEWLASLPVAAGSLA